MAFKIYKKSYSVFKLKSASHKASFLHHFCAGFLLPRLFFAVKLFKNQFQKAAKNSCCIMFCVKINHPKFIFEPKLYMQNCDKLCTTAKLKGLFVQTTT